MASADASLDNRPTTEKPVTDHHALIQELDALLDASDEHETALPVARLEHALTSGYAHALSLEAERWRLEQRLGEAAKKLGAERHGADEISALAERISSAEGDLTRLRTLLSALRERVSAARAAAFATGSSV
jgi:hypothetical protein